MEDNKKIQTADPSAEALAKSPAIAEAPAGKPKRRWKYVGPPFKTGIFLPDLVTKINPDTATDTDIDNYVKRFPKLAGTTFQEIK